MSTVASSVDWHARAQSVKKIVHPFIEGEFRPSKCGKTFPKINPANGNVLANVAEGNRDDVDAAVRSARRAYDDGRWADLPASQRKAVLLRLADLLDAHREELALLEALDVGKPISDALNIDLPLSATVLRFNAEAADKVAGSTVDADNRTLAMCVRIPRGVVAGIVGWNFPLALAMQKIGPALATGNSLVLKPSELSSFSTMRVAELAIEAGVPAGVLNVVPGLGATVGDALAHHGEIDMVSFTGSSATGKRLMQAAGASNMKRLLLECGGKSPNIVFADAPDLDAVVDGVVFRMFWNQGQVCTAGTRLLIEESIKAEFLDRLISKVSQIRAGDPLDAATTFGALVSRPQLDKVMNYIESGRKQGAKLVLGGDRILEETGGNFVAPTIFDAVDPHMTIAQEEIFGPVLSVMSFAQVEEAIIIANATTYGLSSTVWTKDLAKAQRLIRKLEFGEITINATERPSPGATFGSMPMEPHKQSGLGIESGIAGLESYTSIRSVQIHV